MAAHAAMVVTKRRHRLDPADQPALRAPPDQRHPVAKLGSGQARAPASPRPGRSGLDLALSSSKAKLRALGGHSHIRSTLPGLKGKRGGREY